MAIKAVPHAGETETTCTRWRVIVRNAHGKQEWATVHGSRAAALRAEAAKRSAVDRGEYVEKLHASTLAEVIREYLEFLPTKRNRTRGRVQLAAELPLLYAMGRHPTPPDVRFPSPTEEGRPQDREAAPRRSP
jgi:hypothetical protein